MVGVYERVYETAPVFRAEPHDTSRRLAEYYSLDAELGFITDHRDVIELLAEVLRGMFAPLADRASGALAELEVRLPEFPNQIPMIDFEDAQRLLAPEDRCPNEGWTDLDPEQERRLGEWAVREFGSELLFVVGYPMAKRPFYTHPDPERPGRSNSFDLLFRGPELVTGGQRLHRYQDYLNVLAGQDLQPFRGYLQAFRYGMRPTAASPSGWHGSWPSWRAWAMSVRRPFSRATSTAWSRSPGRPG